MANNFNMSLEKKWVKYIVLVTFSIQPILVETAASAQTQPPPAAPAPAPETLEQRVNRNLARMDANGDGMVSRAEFRAHMIGENPDKTPQQVDDNMYWLFPRYDMDRDGVITRADLVRFYAQNPPNRPSHQN